MSAARAPAPRTCPHCGEELSPRALACPECGADAQAGWSDEPDWAGGLPDGYGDDDEFDDDAYEEFLRREGLSDDGRPSLDTLRRQRTLVVCLVLVACILLWTVLR